MDLTNLKTITSSELFTKLNKTHPDGLWSEQIFGPINNYKCECGLYKTKVLYNNKRCKICNVLCASNELRYTTFAKIKLLFFIIHPLKNSQLKKICKKYANILNPIQYDLTSAIGFYLQIINKRLLITDTYNKNCIPLKITGIFTLYLSIKYASDFLKNKEATDIIINSFRSEVIVTPPQTRIIIKKQNKLITGELNNLYIRLLRISKYMYNEYKTYNIDICLKQIKQCELTNIIYQDIDLAAIDLLVSKLQYYTNQIYDNVLNTLSRKEGLIRKSFMATTIDFSARAVTIPNPKLKAYEIIISKKIFIKLMMINFLEWLVKNKYIDSENWISYIEQTEFTNEYVNYIERFAHDFFRQSNINHRLLIFNRQPTLYKYGMTGVEVVGICEEDVIQMSLLICKQLNADFDGDTECLIKLHSIKSLNEIYNNIFNLTNLTYEYNNKPLHTLRLGALYSFNVLTTIKLNNDNEIIEIDDLNTLIDNYELLDTPILYNKNIYTYAIGLINKWIFSKNIIINSKINSDQISLLLMNISKNNEQYHIRLNNLNIMCNWIISCHKSEIFTFPLELKIMKLPSFKLFSKLPNNQIFGQHIYLGLIKQIKNKINKNSKLFKLMSTKFNDIQLARTLLSVGYIADNINEVHAEPIKNSIISGLNEDQFFKSCYGARKGIVDKDKSTPDSGHLERSMVLNLSSIDIDLNDCKTTSYFNIKILSQIHINSLVGRYFYNHTKKCEMLLTNENKSYVKIGDILSFRSPITCQNSNYRICKRCFGDHKVGSPYVGILTGQYIAASLTQLVLQTFHTSGSCNISVNNKFITFIEKHLIDIKQTEDTNILVFDIEIPKKIINIVSTFQKYHILIKDFYNHPKNEIHFGNIIDTIQNFDVISKLKTLNKLLETEIKNINSIQYTYSKLITNILSTGQIYSSFVEITLCNLYICESNKIFRYELIKNKNPIIIKKYNIRRLHEKISKILGLLYEPNKETILKIGQNMTSLKITNNITNIFEQLWLGII